MDAKYCHGVKERFPHQAVAIGNRLAGRCAEGLCRLCRGCAGVEQCFLVEPIADSVVQRQAMEPCTFSLLVDAGIC